MSTVAATMVVEFGQGADSSALVVVELDDTRNLDAAGDVKTSFAPGDLVYFRVHHDQALRIGSVVPTDGSVTALGRAVFPNAIEAQLFATAEAVSITHRPAGGVSATWYGRSAGLSVAGEKLTADNVPCIGRIEYSFEGALYRLQAPNPTLAADETYPVAIVITMEAAA